MRVIIRRNNKIVKLKENRRENVRMKVNWKVRLEKGLEDNVYWDEDMMDMGS